MEGTSRVERAGDGGSDGSGGSATAEGSHVPDVPASSNSSPASAGKKVRNHQNSSSSTVSPLSFKPSVAAQVSLTKAGPASLTPNSPEDNEEADIAYQADDSASSSEEVSGDEFDEDLDEVSQTQILRCKAQANKRNQQTPKNKMAAVTPSTMSVERSSTDPFTDEEATPRNDTPIPINLSSAPRGKSPDPDSGSSSLSSAPTTPTKTPAQRHRPAPFKPKLSAQQEAAREILRLTTEIRETRAEYRRVRGLFEHLTRDENATPEILDAAVEATNRRLVRAIDDDERTQSGNPPRQVPYPPEMIPELLAAVEKAEADKENWYAETRRLYWLFDTIDREKLPALRLKLDVARKKEAAMKQGKDGQLGAAAAQMPVAAAGTPSDKGITFDRSPATARRIHPGETPIASPAASDSSNQATIVRGIRNAMRRAHDADGVPETPTRKSRR